MSSSDVAPSHPRTAGWVIGRVAGARVVVRPSWFVVAAVLTALVLPIVSNVAPQLGAGWTVAVAATFVVVLFASVLVHELAHAAVARRLGQHVHEVVVTALGGHTSFSRRGLGPGGSALIAAAGPLTNIVIGTVLTLVSNQLLDAGDRSVRSAGVLVGAMAGANLLVGAFNLIPGLPLDGGQLLASLVWSLTGSAHRGTSAAAWVGRALAVALLAWVALSWLASGVAPDLMTVGWTTVVAGMVWSGAGDALRSARTGAAISGLTVATLGRPATALAWTASVADGVEARAGRDVDLVVTGPDGSPVATVDLVALGSVPIGLRASTPLGSVAVPMRQDGVVDAQLTGERLVLEVVARLRLAPVVVVTRAGAGAGERRVVAVVRPADLEGALPQGARRIDPRD